MRIVSWMCGVKLKDRLLSKEMRERLGIDDIALVLQQNRLRWYGHVLRKDYDDWVKKCMEYEVEGPRQRGRPKRNNLIPPYDPHSIGSPLPYGSTTLDFQSCGMLPSFTIPVHKPNINWVPVSPVACIISATRPDNPGALCFFIFFNTALTSAILMQSAGPC